MRSLWIRVPASSGNMGPGFDVLGAALGLHNELEIRRAGRSLEFSVEGEGADELAGLSNFVARRLRRFGGLRVRMKNRIPLARGLGSSGAARLAAHAAACALKGEDPRAALDKACVEEGHADNAAASYYGGLVSSRFDGKRVAADRWEPPKGWSTVAAVPAFKLSTERARRALPRKVPLRDAVENIARVAALLSAFARGDGRGLAEGMVDRLHQPYRRGLIPGFERVLDAALAAGALGACLSGAGPSILAVVGRGGDPGRIGRAMENAFARAGVASRALALEFDRRGLVMERS